MKTWLIVLALIALGLLFAGTGIYVGDTDDAPGAGLLGIVLCLVCLGFAVRTALRRAA
jgi:hypothetical protein